MLKLGHIEPDGRVDDAPVAVPIINPKTGKHAATVWVEIATQEELYRMAAKARRHEKDPVSRAIRPVTDGVVLQQRIMARFVKRWEGICDKDGQPLPCTPEVMNVLPEWLADQITEGIKGIPDDDEVDAAEVRDASFRQPA